MTKPDTKTQYPSIPGATISAPSPKPTLQDQDAIIQLCKALLPYTNPFSSDDDKDLVLKVVHDVTGGSNEGFAVADEWYSQVENYPGTDELANRWQSCKDSTEKPLTISVICEMVESYGFDITDICSRAEHSLGPYDNVIDAPDEQIQVKPPAPDNPLDKFSLKGQRPQLLQDVVKQVLALDPVALMGQATSLYGSPGTGKTLIVLYLVAHSILKGNIDATKVYYINVDDTHAGLLEKLEFADEHGFHMLAEGFNGFSTNRFLEILAELIDINQANGVIVIIDTLKKVVDLMSKRNSRSFGKLIRPFVMKGGTCIALAHTNKHRGNDGKPVYAGTSDIVEDFDCAYLMYEVGIDVDNESKTILFENIKSRGNVARQASFRYSIAEGIPYSDILDSVEPVDDTELSNLKQAAELESDAGVIDAVAQCIRDGIDTKMKLANAAAERLDVSKRVVLRIIEKYTGSDPSVHRWNYQVHERGAKKYRLLDPITAGTNPIS